MGNCVSPLLRPPSDEIDHLTDYSSRRASGTRLNSGVRPKRETVVPHSSASLALLGLLALVTAPTHAEPYPDASPSVALRIVLDTQQARIRELDTPDSWWSDTKERTWSVKRPFEPGVLDTTHTFLVTYSIGGKIVASWQVDTRAGSAVAQP